MLEEEVYDNVPVPIVINRDGFIVFTNEALRKAVRGLGYEPDDVAGIGMSTWQVTAPEEILGAHENHRLLESGECDMVAFERVVMGNDGARYRVWASARKCLWKGEPAILSAFFFLGKARDGDSEDHGRVEALGRLTPKERHVAFLVAQGYTNENVSALMEIGESTVRSHLKSIYAKTVTDSRVALIRLVLGR